MGIVHYFLNLSIYLQLAIVCTAIFLFKCLYSMLLGEIDIDLDGQVDSFDSDDSFNFFSIQSILAGLMGLSWTYGILNLTDVKFCGLISIIVGIICLSLNTVITGLVMKLKEEPKHNLKELIGMKCKTYTHFDPKSSGNVMIEYAGGIRNMDAFNTTNEPIKVFEEVVVTDVQDNTLIVKPWKGVN